jgi:hypothetical protein
MLTTESSNKEAAITDMSLIGVGAPPVLIDSTDATASNAVYIGHGHNYPLAT